MWSQKKDFATQPGRVRGAAAVVLQQPHPTHESVEARGYGFNVTSDLVYTRSGRASHLR